MKVTIWRKKKKEKLGYEPEEFSQRIEVCVLPLEINGANHACVYVNVNDVFDVAD